MKKLIVYIVIIGGLAHYASSCAADSIKAAKLKQIETIEEL